MSRSGRGRTRAARLGVGAATYAHAMDLISGRRAADLLAWADLGERQARQVLAAGLAGEPSSAGSMRLYDADRIRRLCETRLVTDREIRDVCPHGLFVGRGRDLSDPS